MLRIGLTGGIGCGKSTISRGFAALGIPIFYCDIEAKKISAKPKVKKKIIASFGSSILNENKDIDNKKLAKIVFDTNNTKALENLNSILHPLVCEKFIAWAKDLEISKPNIKYCIVEAAILFESNMHLCTNYIINVDIPLEEQIKRCCKRNFSNKKQIEERIEKQMPASKRRELANYTIINDNSASVLKEILNLDKLFKGIDKQKKVIISISNDFNYDERVKKVAKTFANKLGCKVKVLAVKRHNEDGINITNIKSKRFKMCFYKNIFFYAELQLKLFFNLLFSNANILYANDLDTLLPNFLISKLKGIPLIYDSHEYFTEVPELKENSFAKRTWVKLEKFIFPKLKNVFTVCDSIAKIYEQKYGVDVATIRNIPNSYNIDDFKQKESKEKYIIYQGAINLDRGVESIIEAMHYVDDFKFYIAGAGNVLNKLKELVKEKKLEDKVIFLGKLNQTDLRKYTVNAILGLSLELDTCLSYKFCLPNKLFDYIQAEIPVLCGQFVEMQAIVNKYKVGEILVNRQADLLAKQISDIVNSKDKQEFYRDNTKVAKKDLCWEKEELRLIPVLKNPA